MLRYRVGTIIDIGGAATWRCEVCHRHGDVDLERIARELGPEFSLLDRRPPCRTLGCPGYVIFYDASSFWRQPMITERDWAFEERQRRRLNALGYRVVMGKWVAPEG